MLGIVVGIVAFGLILIWPRFWPSKRYNFERKHVLITGASQGLGKEIALLLASKGSSISIVARNGKELEKVKAEAERLRTYADQKIEYFVCDVTDKAQVATLFENVVTRIGVPDCLIPCAGAAVPKLFLDASVEDFEKQMQLNYFGTLYTVHAGAKLMKEKNIKGKIVFVSSTMAVAAFVGYSPYAPTKWALRSLCDTLNNEFQMYGIQVQMIYPPSMDTPGFKTENEIKPELTRKIEDLGDLMKPSDVAKMSVKGIECGDYHITIDPAAYALRVLSSGVSPRSNILLEMILLPILALVGNGILHILNYLVRTTKKKTD